MKIIINTLFLVLSISLLQSCSNKIDSSGIDLEVKNEIPFESVFITADSERIEAKVIDEKNLSLEFDYAENFDKAKVEVTLKEGYSLIFPQDLENADLLNYPVLNFRNKENRIVKYWFNISSKAFPVLDNSKIKVVGLENLEVLYENKQVLVPFNKHTMDMQSIELSFEEGSLIENTTIKSSLTFDFTNSLTQKIFLEIDGIQKEMIVRLDLTNVVGNPRTYGFSDISNQFVNEQTHPFIKVYKSNSIPGMPIVNKFHGWEVETPWSWEHPMYMLDWVGDWVPTRQTETTLIDGEGFVVLTIDDQKANTQIQSNNNANITIKNINAFISMTGLSTKEKGLVFWDNKVVSDRMITGDGVAWRGSIGTNAEGKLSFSNATVNNGKMKELPFFVQHPGNSYSANMQDWEVTAAASGRVWALRNGIHLTRQQIYDNDGSGWEVALGEAWNGQYRSRSFVGTTYDNKVALAVLPKQGLSVPQAMWLFEKLGWKNAFSVGGSFWEDNDFTPTLRVNGKVVAGKADQSQGVQYGIAIDIKN